MSMDISLEPRESQFRLGILPHENLVSGDATHVAAPRQEHPHITPSHHGKRRFWGTWRLKLVALSVVGAVIVATGPALWGYFTSYESTDDAQIDGHIVMISSRIDGTVAHVYVRNTQRVKAGQLLADIDTRDQTVAITSARAQVAQAEAQVESAKADYEAALTKISEDDAVNAKAQADVARYRTLFKEGVASRAKYEEHAMAAKVAAAAVDLGGAAATSALKIIASKEAAVKSAQAVLDQALLNLSYTRIIAPIDGVVGKKTVEAGQHVQSAQELLAIVPLDDVWVTANFKETQVRAMRPRRRVTVHVDALGRDYQGHVEGIGAATGEEYSLIPPENATGNYVKVVQRIPIRIDLEPGQNSDRRLVPGMSVEPTVWLR